ncbi:MAG: hypothetical protein WC560_10130 [Syntrophales bacterium]
MVIGMGDYAEFITPSDPRFDSGGIAEWVKPDDLGHSQEEYVTELLAPIKHKIIGLIYGNHEVSIHKHSHQDVHQHICDNLEVPNIGYSCFVRLHFGRDKSAERHMITGCFTHGTGNAITEGAKINNLMRFMKSFKADIYGYAHVHDYIPKSFTRLDVNERGRIGSQVAIGATTGCWFRTYTQGIQASYGETKCYPPNELCCAMYTINPNTDFIDVSRSV